MLPSLKEVFGNPKQASIKMSPSHTKILADKLARNTTIKEIDALVIYLTRLKAYDLEAAGDILTAVLKASGGFSSPLIRASNGEVLRSFLIDYYQDVIDALGEIDV